jgi:hypothetical protein
VDVIAHLKALPRLRLALAVVAIVAVGYVAVDESLAGGVVALIAVAAAVFTVWNPFADRPHPQLGLEVGGEEMGEVMLGATRPVDVEAVVINAKTRAEVSTPSALVSVLGQYQKPTEADYAKYADDVEGYTDRVREWVTEADVWRRVRACLLEATVVQHNPSTVDAEDARVYVRFPPGAEQAGDVPDPPKPPERPKFPLRKNSLGVMLEQAESIRQPLYSPVRVGPLYDTSADFVVSRWEPDYEKTADDGLVVTFLRQPVRHGEREYTGEPFRVLLQPGKHEVRWEVHASNLPRYGSGTWRVICRTGFEGEPITTMAELEAELGIGSDER